MAHSAGAGGRLDVPLKTLTVLIAMMSILFPVLTASAPALAAIAYSQPFPAGTVGYSRPLIGMRVILSSEDRILSATLSLNGTPRPVTYNGSLVYYEPPLPLAAGLHTAEILIDFEGRSPLRKNWEFSVSKDAVTEFAPLTPEQETVLRTINEERRKADLFPLEPHPALNAAAVAHAAYVANNRTMGSATHLEDPAQPGYTGSEPWERGRYFGYPFFHFYEDIHFLADHRQAVRDWVYSVYHRLPIADPAMMHAGYGYAAKDGFHVNVLNVATPQVVEYNDPLEEGIVVYPIPGQLDVPVSWDGNEDPDPYRLFPNAKPGGFPITIQFPRPHVEWSDVRVATITDEEGTPLPFWLLTSEKDEHIRPHIALLPLNPLKPGHRYRVTAVGTAQMKSGEVGRFQKTWWFTTAGRRESLVPRSDIRLMLNGWPLKMEVPPAVKNDRVMIPVRSLLESLGAEVDWDGDRYGVLATLDTRVIEMKIDNDRAVVDGEESLLDAAPFISGNRTLAPVRFLAETLGFKVSWDQAGRTVHLIKE